MKQILTIALFFISQILLAQTTTLDSVIAEKTPKLISVPKAVKPAVLNKKSYSIDIPNFWRISDNCSETLCSLFSPGDTLGGVDIFTENINITVEKLSSASYSVENYTQFSVGYLPSVVKHFKLVEKKKIKANTMMVVYKGEKSGYNQTWRQYYYTKNAKVYIVTFACETPKYTYYLPIVEPYLKSFKLL